MSEIILDESNRRFTIFPIQYPTIWAQFKKQQQSIWSVEEVDVSKDYKDFIELDENVKIVIKMILAFFSNVDGLVNFNIEKNFISKITITEILTTYRFQVFMEGIHNECYSLMIDNFIKDKEEQDYLFNTIKTIPSIKHISDWAFKWIDNSPSIGHCIVAFACIEGILFSGAFATIFWLKKFIVGGKTILNGLIKSNEFISRDERFHVDFACEIYQMLNNKLTEFEAHHIINEAVEIANNFNTDTIKCKLVGLNSNLMNQYIKFIADRLAVLLVYKKIYNTTNPFQWMETIGMPQKTESRSTEYKKANTEYNTKDISNLDMFSDDF